MEIDNTIYDNVGNDWWADDAGFEITSLRYGLNPVRHGYFKRILNTADICSGALLDIGCGGGLLSEDFAKEIGADFYCVDGFDAVKKLDALQAA